jgi:hypothetical protein
MRQIAFFVLLLLAIFASATFSRAQVVRSYNRPIDSLNSAKKESFSSLEGRYAIDLPQQIEGFREGTFEWRLIEGYYSVGYSDSERDLEHDKGSERYALERARLTLDELKIWLLESTVNSQQLTDELISMDGHRGIELRAKMPNGLAIVRAYVVKRRVYSLAVMLVGDQRKYEARALEVFDSFRLTPEQDATAAINRKVAEATPLPLPQGPIATKPKSDADDENLKGPVKRVVAEIQGLSGRMAGKPRRLSSESYYNEGGNLVTKTLYNDSGQPLDITVYGYIDGNRVSKSGFISYESSPPPVFGPPASEKPRTRDTRYELKYVYKYDQKGLLIELLVYGNDGSLSGRVVYERDGDNREELRYTGDGSLNSRTRFKIDSGGNPSEEIEFDSPLRGWSAVYQNVYEVDSRGNWVKRVVTHTRTFNGSSKVDSTYVIYRTITYY